MHKCKKKIQVANECFKKFKFKFLWSIVLFLKPKIMSYEIISMVRLLIKILNAEFKYLHDI